MRCTFVYQDSFNESMQFSTHTALRDEANRELVLDAMEDAMSPLFNRCGVMLVTRLELSAWGTGPGFEGWHQIATRDESTNVGSGLTLPSQCALVVGWRNTVELGVALGRRRNRAYVGPLAVSSIADNGIATDSTVSAMSTAWLDFHSALRGILGGFLDDTFDGICVTSPTEGVIMAANELRIGRAVDTMRSRRQKVPEFPQTFTLET